VKKSLPKNKTNNFSPPSDIDQNRLRFHPAKHNNRLQLLKLFDPSLRAYPRRRRVPEQPPPWCTILKRSFPGAARTIACDVTGVGGRKWRRRFAAIGDVVIDPEHLYAR
jgi:hypothetical protein